MPTAKRFTNFSDELFVGIWDKVDYPIEAGETVLIQDFLAEHFAKHLIDRELTKQDIPTGSEIRRRELYAKCVGVTTIKAEDPTKLRSEILNENKEVAKVEVNQVIKKVDGEVKGANKPDEEVEENQAKQDNIKTGLEKFRELGKIAKDLNIDTKGKNSETLTEEIAKKINENKANETEDKSDDEKFAGLN